MKKFISGFSILALSICAIMIVLRIYFFIFPAHLLANGGAREVQGKGWSLCGYYLKAKVISYHSDKQERIYCSKGIYDTLDVGKIYRLYYLSNPQFKYARMDSYEEMTKSEIEVERGQR